MELLFGLTADLAFRFSPAYCISSERGGGSQIKTSVFPLHVYQSGQNTYFSPPDSRPAEKPRFFLTPPPFTMQLRYVLTVFDPMCEDMYRDR